jgi:hypothetical protein
MLLSGREVAWQKKDPLIEELAKEHRAWTQEAKLLVVRLHMLTANEDDAT